jgi:hypothetical protein
VQMGRQNRGTTKPHLFRRVFDHYMELGDTCSS